MVAISRRSFKIDIEGKVFTCKELSAGYIKSAQDGGNDTAALAIADSMGELSEEDYALFGRDTESELYSEIVRFTFEEPLSGADVKEIEEAFGVKADELQTLSRAAKEELKAVLASRKSTPAKVEASKKPSQS